MSAIGYGISITLLFLTVFAAVAGLSGNKAYAAHSPAQIHLEAEAADRLSGAAAAEGNVLDETSFSYVKETRDGSYLEFDGVVFGLGYDRIAARVATAEPGGSIEFHVDSPTGELLGKLELDTVMENTGEFADGHPNRPWTTATMMTQSSVSGAHSLYVVFKQENDLRYAADLDWIEFGNDTLAGKHTTGITYHVDAYDGKDRYHGKTALAAFKTIGRAVEAALPGDTIIIHEGTYHEAVYVERSGTLANPITFRAAEGEHPIIDGSDLPAQSLFTIANTANNISVYGLTLQNGSGAGFDIRGDQVTIEKCQVEQVEGSGIRAVGAANLYALNNVVVATSGKEAGSAAVSIMESKQVTLRGNEVHDNAGAGISLNGLTVGAIVIGNTLYRNDHAELELNGVSDAFVEQNFIYEPTKGEAEEQADGGLPTALLISDDRRLPECITQNNMVRNNLIANTGAGIVYRKLKECSGFEHTIIENNTFAGIQNQLLSVNKGDYALLDTTGSSVQNNIFYGDEGSVLVDIDTPGNVMLTNNLFYRENGIAAGSFRWGEVDNKGEETIGTFDGFMSDEASTANEATSEIRFDSEDEAAYVMLQEPSAGSFGRAWSADGRNAIRLSIKGDRYNGKTEPDQLRLQLWEGESGERWSYNLGAMAGSEEWTTVVVPFAALYKDGDIAGNDVFDLADVDRISITASNSSGVDGIRVSVGELDAVTALNLSDWQDLSGLDKVYDNLWGDPQFVLQGKKAAEAYELLSSSPAIDAGASANAPSRDFANGDRPMDGNGDGAVVFDVGAYEFSGS